MILDNEEQKNLLLQIVSTTNIQGTYKQVKEATKLVDKLVEDIKNAKVSGK
jgi:ribosomal protein L17